MTAILAFLTSSLGRYLAVGVLAAFVGATGAWKVQSGRIDSAKAETVALQAKFDTFVANVKALGEQQAARVLVENKANLQRAENADAESAKSKSDLAALYAKYDRLRRQGSHSNASYLPAAAANSPSPETATFDRTAFDSGMAIADGILQEGATRLLRRGDQAIVDLDSAKKWAQTPP